MIMPDMETIRVRTVTLAKELISARGILSQRHFSYEELDHLTQHLVITMENHIASETLVDREVRWPKTWWDHFKLRFFSVRMLKRWPVEWASSRLEAKALYPSITTTENRVITQVLNPNVWRGEVR